MPPAVCNSKKLDSEMELELSMGYGPPSSFPLEAPGNPRQKVTGYHSEQFRSQNYLGEVSDKVPWVIVQNVLNGPFRGRCQG